MELNKNSNIAKLYRWFYKVDSWNMPKSLCPYFWKLVIMWMLILPVTIMYLPVIIGSIFNKFKFHSKDDRGFISFIAYLAIFVGTSILISISIIWNNQIMNKESLLGLYQLIGLTLLGILIVGFITYYLTTIKFTSNKPKEKKPSIIKEYIKGRYNKYCPTINWK